MSANIGRFLRDNGFLVAAVALPIVIVALFLLVTAIPRWTVPPPAYDVLLRTSAYDQASSGLVVDLVIEKERLHAVLRPAPANSYPPRTMLWQFDHTTMNVRPVPLELPRELAPGESSRSVPIEALAGRRVAAQPQAPDGYELQNRTHSGTGLVGDLFGMRRYGESASLVNRGRIVPIRLGSPRDYQSPLFVGWLIDEGPR